MSDQDMWTGIVGFLLPIIIAIIQKEKWGPQLQALVAFLVILAVSTGDCYFQGRLIPDLFVHDFLIIFVTAIAAFYGLWKPTGVANAIQNNVFP